MHIGGVMDGVNLSKMTKCTTLKAELLQIFISPGPKVSR